MKASIVHAGLHKTGSTSIQIALRNARWPLGRTLLLPIEGSSDSENAWRMRFLKVAESPGALLSDENLLGSPYDAYSQAARRVTDLSVIMDSRPISFVAYVRAQPLWLQSLYLQGIQQGRHETPEEFLSPLIKAPNLSWFNLGTVLRNALGAGSLDIRPYNAKDVVADFFASQGLGTPPWRAVQGMRVNQSIAPIQGPVLRALLSDSELDSSTKLRIRRIFQDVLAVGARKGFSSFSEAQQVSLRNVLKKDFESLAASDLMSDSLVHAYGLEVAQLGASPLLPWAEATESEEFVWQEALRCLKILSTTRPVSGVSLSRAITKLRRDPAGLLPALKRVLFANR